MASKSRRATNDLTPVGSKGPLTVEQRIFEEGYVFDFFQAVRILHWLRPDRPRVGHGGPLPAEPVRFRALSSLSFPASAIYEISRSENPDVADVMIQTFLGLTGTSGVMPRHYTELMMRMDRERRDPERYVLRDWFDMFNHRMTSLFYRAWEKYRPFLSFERSRGDVSSRDLFTFAMLCFVGLGQPSLNGRLTVKARHPESDDLRETTLAHVDDLALVYYGGLVAQRPRSAVALESILGDYFQIPARVQQFQGEWLLLDPANQTRLGCDDGNNLLGYNALAGSHIWEIQSKFRVRLGPLTYSQFLDFLPDFSLSPQRKSYFVLGHLVRFFVGPDLDYDVQLVLQADEVPECQLPPAGADGPALGWNSWLLSEPLPSDPEDAVFAGVLMSRIENGSADWA